MSWSDPCSNCGQHRADCDCGDWCGYKKKRYENMDLHELVNMYQIAHKNMSADAPIMKQAIRTQHNQMTPEQKRLFDVDTHDAIIVEILKK